MKYTNCVRATQQNTRGQESAQSSELETAHSHNDRKWNASVRTQPRKPNLKTWVPGSKHHAPTRNKVRRRESARLEHNRSRALTWKQDMTGVSGLCHKTMNNPRLKWQNPDMLPSNILYLTIFDKKFLKKTLMAILLSPIFNIWQYLTTNFPYISYLAIFDKMF